jgi:hypothetical protein
MDQKDTFSTTTFNADVQNQISSQLVQQPLILSIRTGRGTVTSSICVYFVVYARNLQ